MCCSNGPRAIPARSSDAHRGCSRAMCSPRRTLLGRCCLFTSRASIATACLAHWRGRRRARRDPLHPKSAREPEPLPKSASDSPSLAPSRKPDRDLNASPETQVVIDFDDNRAVSALVGPYGQNLALVERRLNVVVDSRGNHISIAGSRDGCDAARRVLEILYAQAIKGHDLSQGEVEGAIRAVVAQGSLFEFDPKAPKSAFEAIELRKRPVRARTAAQDSYIRALKKHELVFGIGPAGTGKTWLAVAQAAQLFERKEVDRIILTRPAVEAGERLGFLPGDLREKVDPYLRPIYDALYDLMDSRIVERALQTGEIEIAPLAFMRGRTL